MRTRTLLLLAVVCGFAILAAGTIQLLRLADEDNSTAPLHVIGDAVSVGDLHVTVLSFADEGGTATVHLRLRGVDDPNGVDEFRLVVPGMALSPTGNAALDCDGTTAATQECTLTFDTSATSGRTRVLLYRRGDEVARWQVTSV